MHRAAAASTILGLVRHCCIQLCVSRALLTSPRPGACTISSLGVADGSSFTPLSRLGEVDGGKFEQVQGQRLGIPASRQETYLRRRGGNPCTGYPHCASSPGPITGWHRGVSKQCRPGPQPSSSSSAGLVTLGKPRSEWLKCVDKLKMRLATNEWYRLAPESVRRQVCSTQGAQDLIMHNGRPLLSSILEPARASLRV